MRDIMLIVHFIGLAMGLGASFAFLFLGIAANRMEPERRKELMLNLAPVSQMGQLGLLVLVLSGGYLMTPYWSILERTPLLVAKLLLVLVLGAVVGISSSLARKARAGDAAAFGKMKKLGPIALITALTIVVLAVSVFH